MSEKILKPCNVTLEAYGGFKIKPLGQITVNIKDNKMSNELTMVVADVSSDPIIGLDSSLKLGFVKIDNVKSLDNEKEIFLNDNNEIFEGLGKFNEKCHINLKSKYTAVSKPARRIPLSMLDRLKSKLFELEAKGIIAKVTNPGEFVSNLVIIEKSNKSLRLCIDPQYLNKAIKRKFYTIPTIEEISCKLNGKS